MRPFAKQAATAVLAASSASVGAWAEFAPASFYDRFPVSGHAWIAPTGAYNEHLIRDVGSAYLALFVLTLWGLLGTTRRTTLLVGSVWAAFSVPHLVFHLRHLDDFGTGGKIGNVLSLAGTVVLAGVLLVPERRSPVHDPFEGAKR